MYGGKMMGIGKWKRGRPERRYKVREDMAVFEVMEEDAEVLDKVEMENRMWRPLNDKVKLKA